jgi:pimeloyl-ACP methyl ester carboxylesterase
MGRLRVLGTEVSAFGATVLSMPLGLLLPRSVYDPAAPHPTPVVLVHGFLGHPSNFLALRGYLATCGVRNFGAFTYGPRLDYQRLALGLHETVAAVCEATGHRRVDVVAHSLGGLVARYLVEMTGDQGRVRRLVTLGSPYFASPIPPCEFAIFGSSDPFIAPPHPEHGPHAAEMHPGGRVTVVPDCGHWGLLFRPSVVRRVAELLIAPVEDAIRVAVAS